MAKPRLLQWEPALPPQFSSAGEPALPGDEHSGVHGGRVVLPSRDLVVAKVPCASVFLVLPVTEALQGPLAMVPNGQLGLEEIGRHLEKGRPRGYTVPKPRPQCGAGDGCSLGQRSVMPPQPPPLDTDPTWVGRCRHQTETTRGLLTSSNEDLPLKKSIFLFWQNKYSVPNQAPTGPSLSHALPDSAGNAVNQKPENQAMVTSNLGWRSSIAPGGWPRSQRPCHRALAQVRRAW